MMAKRKGARISRMAYMPAEMITTQAMAMNKRMGGEREGEMFFSGLSIQDPCRKIDDIIK
jgi:hypothetical protein